MTWHHEQEEINIVHQLPSQLLLWWLKHRWLYCWSRIRASVRKPVKTAVQEEKWKFEPLKCSESENLDLWNVQKIKWKSGLLKCSESQNLDLWNDQKVKIGTSEIFREWKPRNLWNVQKVNSWTVFSEHSSWAVCCLSCLRMLIVSKLGLLIAASQGCPQGWLCGWQLTGAKNCICVVATRNYRTDLITLSCQT